MKLTPRRRAMAGQVSGQLYTSTWVLMELADAMAAPARRERFLPFLQFIRANPLVTIVPPDQALFDRGLALYHQHDDKEWSLTDCTSFLIMRDNHLTDALTADHHFVQAGFTVLMK
jgi:uncharacterized protein